MTTIFEENITYSADGNEGRALRSGKVWLLYANEDFVLEFAGNRNAAFKQLVTIVIERVTNDANRMRSGQ